MLGKKYLNILESVDRWGLIIEVYQKIFGEIQICLWKD